MAFSTPRPVCLPLHECLALFFTKSGVPKYSVITRLFFFVVHLFKRSVVSPALAAFCVDSVLSADLMAILVACLVCITLSVYTLVHNSCTLSLRNFARFFQHVSRKSNLHRLERSLQIICGFIMTYQVWSRRVPRPLHVHSSPQISYSVYHASVTKYSVTCWPFYVHFLQSSTE